MFAAIAVECICMCRPK